MKDLRKNEFKDLLEMNELLFQEHDHFIRTDIPILGEISYYPKGNKIQVSKGNKWINDGYLFIKNHLSENPKTEVIQKLIIKHFNKNEIEYACLERGDWIDDSFSNIEKAIQDICDEYKKITL